MSARSTKQKAKPTRSSFAAGTVLSKSTSSASILRPASAKVAFGTGVSGQSKSASSGSVTHRDDSVAITLAPSLSVSRLTSAKVVPSVKVVPSSGRLLDPLSANAASSYEKAMNSGANKHVSSAINTRPSAVSSNPRPMRHNVESNMTSNAPLPKEMWYIGSNGGLLQSPLSSPFSNGSTGNTPGSAPMPGPGNSSVSPSNGISFTPNPRYAQHTPQKHLPASAVLQQRLVESHLLFNGSLPQDDTPAQLSARRLTPRTPRMIEIACQTPADVATAAAAAMLASGAVAVSALTEGLEQSGLRPKLTARHNPERVSASSSHPVSIADLQRLFDSNYQQILTQGFITPKEKPQTGDLRAVSSSIPIEPSWRNNGASVVDNMRISGSFDEFDELRFSKFSPMGSMLRVPPNESLRVSGPDPLMMIKGNRQTPFQQAGGSASLTAEQMQLMEFITQIESGQSVVQQVTVHGAGTVGQSGNGPTHWHQAPGSGSGKLSGGSSGRATPAMMQSMSKSGSTSRLAKSKLSGNTNSDEDLSSAAMAVMASAMSIGSGTVAGGPHHFLSAAGSPLTCISPQANGTSLFSNRPPAEVPPLDFSTLQQAMSGDARMQNSQQQMPASFSIYPPSTATHAQSHGLGKARHSDRHSTASTSSLQNSARIVTPRCTSSMGGTPRDSTLPLSPSSSTASGSSASFMQSPRSAFVPAASANSYRSNSSNSAMASYRSAI